HAEQPPRRAVGLSRAAHRRRVARAEREATGHPGRQVMRTILLVVACALAACKGGSDDNAKKTAPAKQPAADDPWSQPKASDIKDKDLARLVELAQSGPGKAQFPDADAIVALDRDDISYAIDGTVVIKHHSIVKLLDPQRGKDKFADLHIPFDGSRESLVV